MATYRTSIGLLDELVRLGFTNAAYRKLRETTPRDSINGHLGYCAKHVDMIVDGQSERIQRRLQLIRNAHQLGGFTSRDEGLFVALAQAAMIEIPKP